jgi:hypothetical protein
MTGFVPSQKKVRKAYSGMDIDTTPLTQNAYQGAQTRVSASILDRASNAGGSSFASGLSKSGGQGISGAGIANAAGALYQGYQGVSAAIKAEDVNRDALIRERDDKVAYGAKPNVGRATLKSAASGAAAGAAVGSVVPGVGTVIGGAVGAVGGAVAGFVGSKAKERKYKAAMRDRMKEMSRVRNVESGQEYLTPTYAAGGAIAAPENKSGEQAVVLGGNLHEEGGNPVVDLKTGEKVVETEREEMMFTGEQTKQIEDLIESFGKTQDEFELIKLGKLVQTIVEGMKDNSGVYGEA